MIIQSMVRLLYLQNFGQGTGDRRDALVFPTVSQARQLYQQLVLSRNLAAFLDAENESANQ